MKVGYFILGCLVASLAGIIICQWKIDEAKGRIEQLQADSAHAYKQIYKAQTMLLDSNLHKNCIIINAIEAGCKLTKADAGGGL